ncbi:Urb2/Npa2 family-domain-containing protein [Gautieria morchelliformis]|nr:Urb2/Npa2 family-domain-containing protein [Gautieria morchelliformis]
MVQTHDSEDYLHSSQSFVRALKSSTDPPRENGPTKIQIARMGWDSRTLYVPRKAGLIVEWMFTRFHKEKSRRGHENPLLDIDHWSLLADIVTCPGDTQIEPIISQTSIPTLVASFIGLYPTIPADTRSRLLSPLLQALGVFWPIAMQRVGLDALAECLWPSLAVTDQLSNDVDTDGLVGILTIVLTGYHTAFENANSAARKKAYTAISQHQLIPWLSALHCVSSTHPLHRLLYSVGTDILYNPDSLRAFLETNPNSKANSDIYATLFGTSTAHDRTTQTSLRRLLPDLYRDYILALHKHRSSLFAWTPVGQQTRESIRLAALRFGVECLGWLKETEGEEILESIWEATVEILRLTEKEALFDITENGAHISRLKKVAEDALKHLDCAWDDSQSPLATLALDVFSCLQRIHPELSVEFIPPILNRLVTASPALDRPVWTFLSQLTSYHSKTRTLHTLISLLLSALTASFPFLHSADPRATYIMCARSPLLSLTFMDELTTALRTYVTPGQADDIVRSVEAALESFLCLREASQEPERKRRKVGSNDENALQVSGNRDTSQCVIKFALVVRLGTTTLRTVLRKRAGKDAMERAKTCLSNLDALISRSLRTIFHSEGAAGDPNAMIRRKRSRSEHVDDSQWTRQCQGSTVLRLWYELFAGSDPAWRTIDAGESWVATATLDQLSDAFNTCMDQDEFPELHVEIGRVLFFRRATYGPELDRKEWLAYDTILGYVEANLLVGDTCPANSDSTQSRSPYITRQQSALALWRLMLERHLSIIDLHASQQQLDRFARLMIRVQVDLLRSGQDQPPSAALILQRAFTSASFWECGNFRLRMLSALDKQTSVLGSVDAQKWLSAVSAESSSSFDALSNAGNVSLVDVEAGLGVYSLLHRFPPEYLSRASRVDLATKALNADILIRGFSPNNDPTSQGNVEWRAILRSFIVKVAKQSPMKLIEDMASSPEWMAYLTLSKYGPTEPSLVYTQATLDLLFFIQASATRDAIRTEGALLINVLNHFLQCSPYSSGYMGSQPLAHRSLLQFINMLVRESNVPSFQESVLSLIRQLCLNLEAPLISAIETMLGQPTAADFLASEWIIDAWQALLSLRHRFSIPPPVERYGQRLLVEATRIIGSSTSEALLIPDKFRAAMLSLLVTEGQLLPKFDCRSVLSITAAYLHLTLPNIHETACDIPISRASESFSVAQYECALGLVEEGLKDSPGDQPQLITLMRLSTLFMREPPERTSKLSHEHVSRCLRIFLDRPVFMDCSSKLTMKIVDFVQFQCTERAASLNALDVACILSIVSKLLVGSTDHEERSSPYIFQTIVTVLSALVRLRRDLLAPLLPQLCVVLRQLIFLIRGVRPLLGIKQYRIVADTFPKWIYPMDTLKEAEAGSLGRLLTAFTTKSFVRSHNSDLQKADSLARPFVRHAPYVLLSYLEIMNDPLSVLSVSIRRELEPGLFALCTMMGEYGRDTLMVQSLDVGGKAVLKSLWKEYDKQKYIGRG